MRQPKPTQPEKEQPAMTLEQAKALTWHQTIYHRVNRNADGSAQRWRVNGLVKTWKRDPSRVSIPVKYGLKTCDILTERELDLVSLTDCR